MNPESSIRIFYELQPAFPLAEGWQFFAVLLPVLAVTIFVVWLSLRDSRKLPRGIATALIFLRLIAMVGLVVYLLNPSQRNETRVIKESRLSVLIDTSLSMGLVSGDQESSTPAVRIDAVRDWFSNPEHLDEFRKNHELLIYRFDESDQPELLVAYPKLNPEPASSLLSQWDETDVGANLRSSHFLGWLASAAAAISCVFLVPAIITLFRPSRRSVAAVCICLSTMMFVAAMILFACSDLRSPELGFLRSVGWISTDTEIGISKSSRQVKSEETELETTTVDWKDALTPRGTSTQIGVAIQSIVNQERGGPIAGMILITDGVNNAGSSPARHLGGCRCRNRNFPDRYGQPRHRQKRRGS